MLLDIIRRILPAKKSSRAQPVAKMIDETKHFVEADHSLDIDGEEMTDGHEIEGDHDELVGESRPVRDIDVVMGEEEDDAV
jgi:hypothetical protein